MLLTSCNDNFIFNNDTRFTMVAKIQWFTHVHAYNGW